MVVGGYYEREGASSYYFYRDSSGIATSMACLQFVSRGTVHVCSNIMHLHYINIFELYYCILRFAKLSPRKTFLLYGIPLLLLPYIL